MMAPDLRSILAVPRGVIRIVHRDGRVEDVLGEPTRDDVRALLGDDELDVWPVPHPDTGEPTGVYAAHGSVPLFIVSLMVEVTKGLTEQQQRGGA